MRATPAMETTYMQQTKLHQQTIGDANRASMD
jgi:hypothetical protein